MTSSDEGPASTKRRQFLKGGIAAAIGLAIVGITGPAIFKSAQNLLKGKTSRPLNGAGTQTTVNLSSLGAQVPVSEVLQTASFPISAPRSLPAGTSLTQSRIASDGNMVTLLYGNSALEPLGLYDDGSAIAIFQIKEQVVKGPPSFLPPAFQRVSVNGNAAFARGSSTGGEPGQLQWWSGGKRISIFANLGVSDLVAIGNSMGDTQ